MCVSAEIVVTPGTREVEVRDVVAELLAEREEEAAEAAVDVQPDAVLERELAERRDRVDRAVAVVAGRADDRDRVASMWSATQSRSTWVVGGSTGAMRISTPSRWPALLKRGVRGLGLDQVRATRPPGVVLAVREDGVGDRAGAAGRHEARRRRS